MLLDQTESTLRGSYMAKFKVHRYSNKIPRVALCIFPSLNVCNILHMQIKLRFIITEDLEPICMDSNTFV